MYTGSLFKECTTAIWWWRPPYGRHWGGCAVHTENCVKCPTAGPRVCNIEISLSLSLSLSLSQYRTRDNTEEKYTELGTIQKKNINNKFTVTYNLLKWILGSSKYESTSATCSYFRVQSCDSVLWNLIYKFFRRVEAWMRDTWMGHSAGRRDIQQSGGGHLPARHWTIDIHDCCLLNIMAYGKNNIFFRK